MLTFSRRPPADNASHLSLIKTHAFTPPNSLQQLFVQQLCPSSQRRGFQPPLRTPDLRQSSRDPQEQVLVGKNGVFLLVIALQMVRGSLQLQSSFGRPDLSQHPASHVRCLGAFPERNVPSPDRARWVRVQVKTADRSTPPRLRRRSTCPRLRGTPFPHISPGEKVLRNHNYSGSFTPTNPPGYDGGDEEDSIRPSKTRAIE